MEVICPGGAPTTLAESLLNQKVVVKVGQNPLVPQNAKGHARPVVPV